MKLSSNSSIVFFCSLNKNDKFNEDDILEIRVLILILKPFSDATLTLSHDHSTINIILPTFLTIKKKFS
jgi:hypothetical protein